MFFEKKKYINEINLVFLHPEDLSHSFDYSTNTDILWILLLDIQLKVNPLTPIGQTYTIPNDETQQIIKTFHQITRLKKKRTKNYLP